MRELNNKLLSLMAIRVLVVLSVLLPYLLAPGASGSEGGLTGLSAALWDLLVEGVDQEVEVEGPAQPETRRMRDTDRMLQLLVGLVSVQTLIYAGFIRLLKNRPVPHAYFQLVGDMGLVTLLIYKFGSLSANLSILYFVVIGVASFLLRRQAGLIMAALACALYGGVVFLHHTPEVQSLWEEGGPLAAAPAIDSISGEPIQSTWIERFFIALQPPPPDAVSSVPVTYTLTIHWIGFLASAFFTSYLARDEQLESQLKKSALDLAYLQVLHQDVIQSISSGLAVTDLRGVTTNINRAGERILGLSESELIGSHIEKSGLFGPGQWEQFTAGTGDETVRAELHLEADWGAIELGFNLSQLRDGQGTHRGYIVIFQDLTETRQLEERVRIQDRMAALGQMAAGLAHEVGNPLAAISGSVQMLSKSVEGGSMQAKLLGITLKESQRLDRTVKAFLQFARPRERDLKEIDVARVLADDVTLLKNSSELLPQHEIELDLQPEPAMIVADRDQISQLFWNLARNSLQAMPSGGTLSIKGRLDETRYRIEVRDNGKGMSDQERAELFQPFKTFFGKGTGLGMAIVYRIVEEHQGNIEVDSRPGWGTVITVDLPVEPPNSAAEDATAPPVSESLDYPHPEFESQSRDREAREPAAEADIKEKAS